MNLQTILKDIDRLSYRLLPLRSNTGDYNRNHVVLNYNEMTFIPFFDGDAANRLINNAPPLEETFNIAFDMFDTIQKTDLNSFTSSGEIRNFGLKNVSPFSLEPAHVSLRTEIQDELNDVWMAFHQSEESKYNNTSNNYEYNDPTLSGFFNQKEHIQRLGADLVNEFGKLKQSIVFYYTILNHLEKSFLHPEDKAYIIKTANDYISKMDISKFETIYNEYTDQNEQYLSLIKNDLLKFNPTIFMSQADFFIASTKEKPDSQPIQVFLNEKILTENSESNVIEFTAAQKINKLVLFDDKSIAFKRNGEYHTVKSTEALSNLTRELHYDAISFILRKKPATINFFKNKLKEDNDKYGTVIKAATSFIENYPVLKQYNFDLNSLSDSSCEVIDDDIHHIVLRNKVKQFAYSILSAKYKHHYNETTEPYFQALLDNHVTTAQLQTFVGKKLAALQSNRDVVAMLNGVLNHFNEFTQEALTHKLEAFGIKKIYDEDNVVTFEVDNYEQCRALGSTSWCIVREEHYFDQYAKDADNRQYIMYDFNKQSTDIESMVGFTVVRKGNIYAEHWKNDDSISSYGKDKTLLKIQYSTLYKNQNRHEFSDEIFGHIKKTLNIKDDVNSIKPLKMRA